MIKSLPYLIPARPLLVCRRCGGTGRHIAFLWDGNLPEHHWEMTEPDAILPTTTSEMKEQSGLFVATNSPTGKSGHYLRVRTFVMVQLNTAPRMEVVGFSMLFFPAV